MLEFLAIKGRSYSIESSTNLTHWTPVSFRLLRELPEGPERQTYLATDVHTCLIEVVEPGGLLSPGVFYKAKVE